MCAEMRILVNRMKFCKTNIIHAKSAVELENSFYAILNISSLKIYPSTFYTLSFKCCLGPTSTNLGGQATPGRTFEFMIAPQTNKGDMAMF
jgi:hypothetical protein